jgi:DNA-binding PadR family transcriptional regulator
MYGYEISQKLKELSKGMIEVKEGSLYPALHKLEAEGLLDTSTEVVDNRLRKYYTLSRKGRGVRAERVSELEEMIQIFQQFLKPQGI